MANKIGEKRFERLFNGLLAVEHRVSPQRGSSRQVNLRPAQVFARPD